MDIQRTVYAVTIKSHVSLFERIYHVLSDCALNAGEKAVSVAEKDYNLSDLYVEKSPIVCYLDGLIESSGEAEVGDEEQKQMTEFLDNLEKCPEWDWSPKWLEVLHKIQTYVRQRRTVSREQVEGWAVDMGDSIGVGRIEIILKNILAELGYTIEEPKKEGEEKT